MDTQAAYEAREAAHNYLGQAKAVLDVIILAADDSDEGSFGTASKTVTLSALDAVSSLIAKADREVARGVDS